MNDFSQTWLDLLDNLMNRGVFVAPRGKVTKEIPQHTIVVDMRRPVLTIPERKLSYRFMAAEAHWILSGDNRVETIAPYNNRIKEFSDDGETFFGAYGPKIIGQLPHVVRKLKADPMSRQAGLTIWRENPPETKDYPCTVAMFFSIREEELNCHVFMRSSDAWLGVPYDVFNFSMVTHYVCALLNQGESKNLSPGRLFLTMASSHLYQENFDRAVDCLTGEKYIGVQPLTPDRLWHDPMNLLEWLRVLKDGDDEEKMSHRWWESSNAPQ